LHTKHEELNCRNSQNLLMPRNW